MRKMLELVVMILALMTSWLLVPVEAGQDGMKTVRLDSLPAELRAELLARQAAEQRQVEPGLHASDDGTTFVYGGAVPPAVTQTARPAAYTASLSRDLPGGIEVTASGSAY